VFINAIKIKMMRRNKLFICVLCFSIAACRGQDNKVDSENKTGHLTFEEKQKADLAKRTDESKATLVNPDFNFRLAAKRVTPGVVHIRSTYSGQQYSGSLNNDFWYRFFSEGDIKPQANASGVIVSSDGYIVTNDHVIEDAEDVEIILYNERSYKAKIIGIDPETDLALLKIEETNLPFIEFGNSDEVEVGDWVLAVGNPFNLTSTVTAGIVSAKARNINILKRRGAVEAYIQTDAAVNPGNSGGALVDYNGKLVGINSAIATPTGAYAGYSFATPVNIVKKIIDDLLVGGKVKRGYLGAVLKNVPAGELKLSGADIAGVYIDSMITGGAAMEADLKLKDVIVAVDSHKVVTTTNMKEMLEQHRPGEVITLTILRDGKEKYIPVTLKAEEGTIPRPVIAKAEIFSKLGIRLEELTKDEKKKLNLTNGLKVVQVSKGKVSSNTNIKRGFIITKINGKRVNTQEDLVDVIDNSEDAIMLEGIYPDYSGVFYYAFSVK
jgi:serine protease Do